MSDEKNKKKTSIFWEKIKNVNFKKFARAFAIVWMILFIIVMTITNVGIDENFNWIKWLGSAMILFGIAVFGLFIGESMGADYHRESKTGLYQENLNAYNVFKASIEAILVHFDKFYDWLVPQRLESKQINFLIMNDINPKKAKNIVLYCDYADLWPLQQGAIKKEVNGKEIYINKLAPHELEPVKELLSGGVKLELSGVAYYLQAFAVSDERDILEKGVGYRKARKYNKTSNRAIRLVGGAVISLALGILTVNDFMNTGDAQAWTNLVTRIANLFTALFSGWLSGTGDVKLEANAIQNKTDVLKYFKSAYDKKLFEILDEDELAEKNYKEQEKKKKEVIDDILAREEVLKLEGNSNQIEMKGE